MGKDKDKKEVEINQRQKEFCRYYVETKWKKEEAAILSGYSKKTAYSQANRLLKNVRVQKYLNGLIEDDLGMQRGQLRHRVLTELEAIAFADTSNDINVVTKTEEVPIKDEMGKPTGETETKEYQVVEMIDTKNSNQTKAIKSISQDRYGVIKIEYYDKDSALDKLAKYGGLYKDQTVIVDNSTDNSVTNIIDYSSLTEEENKQLFMDALNKDK
jgi:phage terminase small subunit